MDRRRWITICVGGMVGAGGCLSSDGEEESNGGDEEQSDPLGDLDKQDEFSDQYGSLQRRISNSIEDYDRGQDLVDSENYLQAEDRFRDAERELDKVYDDLLELTTEVRLEYGDESEVTELLDSIGGLVMGYESAAEMGKEGAQDLAEGSEVGYIMVNGAEDLIEESDEVDIPSETEFSTMLYDA